MTFIREIRQQSELVRLVIFMLCTVVTVVVIGGVWFNAFQRDTFTLLNPDENFESKFMANNDAERATTPRSFLTRGINTLRAGIYHVLDIKTDELEVGSKIVNPSVKVHELPLSGDRSN